MQMPKHDLDRPAHHPAHTITVADPAGRYASDDQMRAYVRSVAMKYVRDEQDAEDVTQDAMLLAHRYRDSFRGESRYSTWLYRVTATAALMFLRKQRRLAREIPASGSVDDEGTALLERQPATTDLSGEVIARADLGVVAEAVAKLGAKYPAVFWKRYGEGRTETEIARELGLSVAAVKTRAFRARQAALAAVR
ncbi:MAG TPA: sigma-70 family RNA polymerase sigma factor [Kofleriaceae bacterium]|nr:sigma-70 family RNA polymerase sigma factor [Kofleriaceae bacterium]